MEPFKASEDDWQTVKNGAQVRACVTWRTILELRDRVAALEASAAAATQPPVEPPNDPQTLHTVALGMVETLERSFHLAPQIVETIQRAIREPMVADGGPVATDDELDERWEWEASDSVANALRSAYNLGRQHATTCPHIRQGTDMNGNGGECAELLQREAIVND